MVFKRGIFIAIVATPDFAVLEIDHILYIKQDTMTAQICRKAYHESVYTSSYDLSKAMVGGRKNFAEAEQEDSSQVYFPEWMYYQLEKGEDLAIQIQRVEETDIVKRLIIVGLWCIQWYPADRPSTEVVIQMLEGEHMPPNPFQPGGWELIFFWIWPF